MNEYFGQLLEFKDGTRLWNARDTAIPAVIINKHVTLTTGKSTPLGVYIDEKPSLKQGDLIMLDPPIKSIENAARKLSKQHARGMNISRKDYETNFINTSWQNGMCVPYDATANSPDLDILVMILTRHRNLLQKQEKSGSEAPEPKQTL
jgi:hypothetical protein